MNFIRLTILSLVMNLVAVVAPSQSYVVRDIRSFGAKGDGRTNDQAAFVKAAIFFNKRGGNGKLTISPGTYIVGKQFYNKGVPDKAVYDGQNVLHLKDVKNVIIQGYTGAILKYYDGYRMGAFDPVSGKPFLHGDNYFVNWAYAALMRTCIYLENVKGVSITGFEIHGNNQKAIVGGVYGDKGIQLAHYGIYINNSKNILIDKMNVHHMSCDGICISNELSATSDSITITNSAFEYNARQGLTWIAGNHLTAKNCKFNHSGRGAFLTAPAAGVDIESETGPIKNGLFEGCEFINNAGNGLLADSDNVSDCTFNNSTFWGTSSWSIWVTRPRFTFNTCNIYGSFVHGYDSPNDRDATKFNSCSFEDKPYNGEEAYGTFLIESNGKRRVSFENCTFTANTKKLCWVWIAPYTKPEEKYKFTGCRFIVKNASYPVGDFVGITRGLTLKNNVFEFRHPDAKKKRHVLGDYEVKGLNTDLGGNRMVYF